MFGPLVSEAQHDIVLGYLHSARQAGARVTTGGGKADLPGFFVEPTVLADVTPGMRVAREEIFGPVVTIVRYESLEEALDITNNTGFGLGGLVFSSDPKAALVVADRMDTGSVGLTSSPPITPRPSVAGTTQGLAWSTASRGWLHT